MNSNDETVEVETKTVACDGGALGHPKVFLHLKENDRVTCPYCGRCFVLKKGTQASDR